MNDLNNFLWNFLDEFMLYRLKKENTLEFMVKHEEVRSWVIEINNDTEKRIEVFDLFNEVKFYSMRLLKE